MNNELASVDVHIYLNALNDVKIFKWFHVKSQLTV